MRFWQSVSYPETEQLPAIARIAEEVGFDGILVSDHLFLPEKLSSPYPYTADGSPGFDGRTEWPEPWSVISAMAAVTSRIRFATMVYILPLRDPFHAAKAAATAAVLSNGRVSLGIGVGWMREEYDQVGRDFKRRGKRCDEMIAVMRKLWTGEMVEHHGEFFDFDRLQMSPAARHEIPIWVGGTSDAALRRATQLCDGWIGSGNDASEVPAVMTKLHELRRAAGRKDEPFEAIVPITSPPDPDVYRRLEEQGVTSMVSYPFPFVLGPQSTIAQKRDVMARYADDVIARVNR